MCHVSIILLVHDYSRCTHVHPTMARRTDGKKCSEDECRDDVYTYRATAKTVPYDIYGHGGRDALRRRVVTKSWDVWKEKTVWLTGYFSSAVWLSLLFIHLPVVS